MDHRRARRHLLAGVLILLGVCHAPRSAMAAGGRWTTVLAAHPELSGAVAVWDPVGHRIVTTGGVNGSGTAQGPWSMSAAVPTWVPLEASGGAVTSRDACAAYDPDHQSMVVFGGIGPGGPTATVSVLSLGAQPTWTHHPGAGESPEPTVSACMVHDPLGHRMIVFGGQSPLANNQVWELRFTPNATWREIHPPGPLPPPRSQAAAVYDPVQRRMIVFGGSDGAGGRLGDLWALSLGDGPETWTELQPAGTAPAPRSRARMVVDTRHDRALLFGGQVAGGSAQQDLWALDLTDPVRWVSLTPTGPAPPARFDHGSVFDPTAGRMWIAGGTQLAPGDAPGTFALDVGPRVPAAAYQPLPFVRTFSSPSLTYAPDDWSGVPGQLGFTAGAMPIPPGTDPRSITTDDIAQAIQLDIASNPEDQGTSGRITLFFGQVLGLAGSSNDAATSLYFFLDATNARYLAFECILEDLVLSYDEVVPLALQYRRSHLEDWTNVPGGFIADATPADEVGQYRFRVLLPEAAGNTPTLELRIVTTHPTAPGDWVGIWHVEVTEQFFLPGGPELQLPEGNMYGPYSAADIDSDGDLDLTAGGYGPFKMFLNGPGGLIPSPQQLPGQTGGGAQWGDYDNDGDVDLVLLGYSFSFPPDPNNYARLYRNDSGLLVDTQVPLAAGAFSQFAKWGDLDRDGDLDLLLSDSFGGATSVYVNSAGSFTPVPCGFAYGISDGAIAWRDWDGDGDADAAIMPFPGHDSSRLGALYRNDSGSFTDIGAGVPGGNDANLEFADVDGDGKLDLIYSTDGALLSPGAAPIGYLLQPESGPWTRVTVSTDGLGESALAVGDVENDGDPDVVYARSLFENLGGPFTFRSRTPISGVTGVLLADFDGDRALDLVQSGDPHVHYNAKAFPNEPPTTPTPLGVTATPEEITFRWAASSDDHTPAQSLGYNLRVGTTFGGCELVSPMADDQGHLFIPHLGNVGPFLERTLSRARFPESGPIYWSVQAIDGAFVGSAFAPKQVIALTGSPTDSPPRALQALCTPNPARSGDALRFTLPDRRVRSILITDVQGRTVQHLTVDLASGARGVLEWNPRRPDGGAVGPGIYFARYERDATSEVVKFVIVN